GSKTQGGGQTFHGRLPAPHLASWGLMVLFSIVYRGQAAQVSRRRLGREVALGLGQHLVADHELAHSCRAQQRRVEVGMKLPVLVTARITWCAVPAHWVREGDFKQVVIADEQRLKDVRQRVALCRS